MLRVLKVTGESLSPLLHHGDYVLAWRVPVLLHRLKVGDILVLRHPVHGVLVKRLERIEPGGELYVTGAQPDSLDSRRFGSLPYRCALGKVVMRFRTPSR